MENNNAYTNATASDFAPTIADAVPSTPAPAWAVDDDAEPMLADVTLSKAQIKAICLFASSDGNRPNLNQVRFQGSTVLATDGHRLAVFGPEITRATCSVENNTAAVGITPEHLIALSKSMKVTDAVRITDVGCTLTRKDGTTSDVTTMLPTLDDENVRYPAVHQVIPWNALATQEKTTDRGAPWVNASYLADAAQAATLAGYTRADVIQTVRIICDGDLDPVSIFAHRMDGANSLQALVVVMPVRR